MICPPKNPAMRRFTVRLIAANVAYLVFTIFVGLFFYRFHPTGPIAYPLAVLPAVAILGVIVTFGLYLEEEKDEFQRNMLVQALLWGLGGVFVFTSAWGSLETFTHIRHFQPSWTFQVFWAFVAIRIPFLLKKYR
jgi:hypothetical protein